MAKLINQLQEDALDKNIMVSDLLRKALVVARKLDRQDFYTWITHELNGYPSGAVIPMYRYVTGMIKAFNPYNGWIPVIIEDPRFAKALTHRPIGQNVASFEELANSDSKTLMVPYPAETENLIMKGCDDEAQPMLHIGAHQINGILDSVRNELLKWALDVEEQGVTGENMTFSDIEKQIASNFGNLNIGSFQGILGNVTNSEVTQTLNMNIKEDDFNSLKDYLISVGADAEEITELEKCIQSDPWPENRDCFGPKVSGWIGTMVSKAFNGALNIAGGTAGSLLANAIWLFYGLG